MEYALTSSFKLTSTRRYYHPVWSLLLQAQFPETHEPLIYKRHYKSAQGFTGKWVDLARGNLISLFVYFRKDFNVFWDWFMTSPISEEILNYYKDKGKLSMISRSEIQESMNERVLKGLQV